MTTTSSSGKLFSLLFLPATPSSLSQTLEGLFQLTRRPSRALALYVASRTTEIQGHRQLWSAEVPGHRQQQLAQTLMVRLLKTHFLHRSLIVKSQQNRIE